MYTDYFDNHNHIHHFINNNNNLNNHHGYHHHNNNNNINSLSIVDYDTGSSSTLSIVGNGSQEALTAINTRGAILKRTTRRERKLFIILVVVIITSVALLVAFIVLACLYYRKVTAYEICSSPECIRSAANLARSMDITTDPCEDFYRFSCGGWHKDHPIPESSSSLSWFDERANYIEREIKEYLQRRSSRDEPLPVGQARRLYNQCKDTDELEKQGLRPLKAALDLVGLPLVPPPPLGSSGKFLNDGTDWVRLIARAKRFLGQESFIGVGVYWDMGDRSINRIMLGRPDVNSPLPSYQYIEQRLREQWSRQAKQEANKAGSTEPNNEEKAYVEYLKKAATYAQTWSGEKKPKVAEDVVWEVLRFEQSMNRILFVGDINNDYYVMKVDDLQELTNTAMANGTGEITLDWRQFLEEVFSNVENVTLDLDGGDEIALLDKVYIVNLAENLSNVSAETLWSTLWWQMFRVLAPHTDKTMRQLNRNYLETSLDLQVSQSRSLFCASAVNKMLGMVVGYMYAADPKFLNTTRRKVGDMLEDIQWAFKRLILSVDWMDYKTKMATLEKAAAMSRLVGFPDWLLNKTQFEEYYADLSIAKNGYLINLLKIPQKDVTRMLTNLRVTNPENMSEWATDPTVVNAYHTFQLNTITIPAAILQFPFYNLGLESLNYGAIGSILGHELTHGFDETGRQYNKKGDLRPWWTDKTVQEYKNRTKCFISQYSNVKIPEVGKSVDGKMTLDENIADNGGVLESYTAYVRYVQRAGAEKLILPGFANYTDLQMFFLSYGNIWCTATTPQALKWALQDEHSPNHVRVWGALSNLPAFSKAWGCRQGTAMNPQQKCRLW